MYRVITGSDGRKYLTDEPLLHPPKREWVGLTEDERQEAYYKIDTWDACVDFVESKLKEKNV